MQNTFNICTRNFDERIFKISPKLYLAFNQKHETVSLDYLTHIGIKKSSVTHFQAMRPENEITGPTSEKHDA
jgi:hypothetical protein